MIAVIFVKLASGIVIGCKGGFWNCKPKSLEVLAAARPLDPLIIGIQVNKS